MPSPRHPRPASPRDPTPVDGVLVVDKPAGPTSHDIVDRVRRIFHIRKVGHGGTLDPMATGVLILLIGRATKLSNLFLGSDKTYEGTMRLGIATDSHDAAGNVTAERDCSGVSREALEGVMARFRGDQMQTPPMVSAIKVDGIPLYKRARRGQTVEREPRLIHVYEFSLGRFALPEADFQLRCTKGTYVRTICADVGDALGCGAHLSRLRRTRAGELTVAEAVPVAELTNWTRDDLVQRLLPLSRFSDGRVYRPR
jgi:tRNA pseudouridine55 synthase